MMIRNRPYTSGRIAVANLSALIASFELRRVEGATFENLVALSKLLFVRGDLLGRIADHDRAELVANEAIASSPDTASALYLRAWLAERFHRFEEANALLDQALAAGYRTQEIDVEKAALLQASGRSSEALGLRERLAKDDPGIHTLGALASLLAEMDQWAAAENCYAAALDADEGISPIPCGQLLFEWGVSAMRRGDLDRAEAIFVELEAILPQHVPGRGHRAEVALARGQLDVAAALITPLLETSDDPEYRAIYAETLAARGDREAASEAERAAAGYELLLARRPEAYADHAAAFFMGVGNRPQRAVELASANWKLRDTPRSRSLLAKALRNAQQVSPAQGGRMGADNFTAARGTSRHKVVVIGGGFAGIAVVRELRDSDAEVTLVDRNNHHLFQPFLFQVATSILEPAEIATPIRSLLKEMPNVRVEMCEARRIDTSRRVVVMSEGDDLPYDVLVVATGAQTSYFGHESEWAQHALGLKTLPDAIAARNRLLKAFERAEMESDPAKQARDTTVVVVGGGPTGVAITGTISEFVRRTLPADFRNIDIRRARIVLVEAGPRLLPAFSERHSSYATRALERAGVEVRLGVPVTHVDAAGVTIGEERIEAAAVLWCTGVQGVPLASTLGTHVTANGKVAVGDDFSVPGHPDCFVIGDAAHVVGADGRPVPGLASVAQQQGRYVGKLIAARLMGSAPPTPIKPTVPSKLATITRHIGIAEYGGRSITGFPAWLMWGLLHLRTLSDGHSKLSILANWLRLLITYRRSARLIVEQRSTAER